MPFIADQPTTKAGGFIPDAPSGDQPTAPQGPFRHLSATGQPTASATVYDPAKDPFVSQGTLQNLVRNLPRSPALPFAGGVIAPLVGAPMLAGEIVGGGVLGAGMMPEHPLLGAVFGSALTGITGSVGKILGSWLGKSGAGFEKARESLTKAADVVRDKIPQDLKLFNLPGKAAMTFDEAVTALRGLRGGEFKAGVADFIKQLDRVEVGRTIALPGIAAPTGTAAGETFGTIATKELFDPKPHSAIINTLANAPGGDLALGAVVGAPLAQTLGPEETLRALIHRVIGGF